MDKTVLSEKQLKDLQQAFDLFDKDGSGCISFDELHSVMKSIGITSSDKDLQSIFKQIDSDNSGTINFEEFVRLMSKRSNNGAAGGCGDDDDEDEDLKKVFSIFDKDNNGYITADELKVAMENLNEKLTDDDVNEMIREADLNNDGKVNYEEFIRMMKQK